MMSTRKCSALALVAAMIWSAAASSAEPPSEDAGAIYDAATESLRRGDYHEAARGYAKADELAPHAAALEAALIAVMRTEDAALGMTLADRVARDPSNERLGELAGKLRERFEDRAGRLIVECRCELSIDGVPAEPGVAVWLEVGRHHVNMRLSDRTEGRDVDIVAARTVAVRPTETPPEPAPEAKADEPLAPGPAERPLSESDGISPAVFWIGVAVTTAVGVGTVVSFVDLKNIADEFEEQPTEELASEGEAAQLRTRVLLGVSAASALATTLIGGIFVDWGGDEAQARLRIEQGGAQLSLRVPF
jgi:hypothetical protein